MYNWLQKTESYYLSKKNGSYFTDDFKICEKYLFFFTYIYIDTYPLFTLL
jgi:hypothetical protein